MMADKTIKHFIFMRFFPTQVPSYPYDVLDVDFLSNQLVLAKKHALSSLENQSNKDFELVFMLHEKMFSDKKYEFIFSGLQDSFSLPIKFIKGREIYDLVKNALNEYDFVIQSRMDFDDFVYKDAVTDTQSKINECNNILAYGYCKGYTYIYGELCPYFMSNVNGYHSVLGSVILKSSFAKEMPFIGAQTYTYDKNGGRVKGYPHTQTKVIIKEFVENNGIEFSESMFQQNISTNAFIYFRSSEFSLWLHRDPSRKINVPKNFITEGITRKQLKDEFGFTLDLKSIKDEEPDFNYDFKSTQEEEFGFRQDLRSMKWG